MKKLAPAPNQAKNIAWYQIQRDLTRETLPFMWIVDSMGIRSGKRLTICLIKYHNNYFGAIW
jgi:hypothetical protein